MIKIFKNYLNFIQLPKQKILFITLLSIFEAFFALSGVILLLPLIKFLQDGKEVFLETADEHNLILLVDFLNFLNVEISILALILCAVIPLLVQQFLRYTREIMSVKLQVFSTRYVRTKVIETLLKTSEDFYLNRKLGVIANIMTKELMATGSIITYSVALISNVLILCVLLIFLFFISIKLTLITMLMLSVVPIFTKKMTSFIRGYGKENVQVYGRLQAFLIERIKLINKIKINLTEKYEYDNFIKVSKESDDLVYKIGSINALINSLIEPVIFIIVLIVLYFGIVIFQIDFSTITIFLFAVFRLNSPIRTIVMNRNQILIYQSSFEKVQELYYASKKMCIEFKGEKDFPSLHEKIAVSNIDLSYGSKHLFESLNLQFNKNETTAIVGKSGSGKTSLISLLLSLRVANSGHIVINGMNLDDVKIDDYLNKVGYLSQSETFFNGTISENLLYGLENKSSEEIEIACKKAHAWEFIDVLEDKFDTFIGENGGKLSGGQRQRLALAHLFLKDPEIIIMDEPTSALDSESESVIIETLKEMHGSKTIIIIAHRLSTIRHADKIVVMESGKVIEEGSHESLIQNESKYKKYFDKG